MLAGSLHDELLAIEGIAAAEFEGTEEHPVGVRIQLAAGADADVVGREVQRVLASHGMRSQMAEERATAPAVAPTIPSGSVVNLSDYEVDDTGDAVRDTGDAVRDTGDAIRDTADAAHDHDPFVHEAVDEDDAVEDDLYGDEAGEDDVYAVEDDVYAVDDDVYAVEDDVYAVEGDLYGDEAVDGAGDDDVAEDDGTEADLELIDGPPPEVAVPQVAVDATEAVRADGDAVPAAGGDAAREASPAAAAVAGVGIEEDAERITVTVRSTSGESVSQSVPATSQGLDQAAALATASLAQPDAAPRVVAVTDSTIEGSPVVTVVLETVGGRRVAGASVVTGSRAYAVARATWAALHA